MHIVDDALVRNDKDNMLRQEIGDALANVGAGNPDGGVLGDGQFAGEDGEVDAGEVVGIVDRVQIDVADGNLGNH